MSAAGDAARAPLQPGGTSARAGPGLTHPWPLALTVPGLTSVPGWPIEITVQTLVKH